MHEVAQEIAETEVAGQSKKNYPHLCLHDMDMGSILRSLGEFKRLHTLFVLGHIKGSVEAAGSDTSEVFSKVKYLRVLQLCHKSIRTLPSNIYKLVHLRFLDLSYNYELQFLPATVCDLINLQTLKLKKCWSLQELPRNLSKLVNLKHLDLNDCFNLTHMPPGMCKLTCLQTLSRFVVCFDSTAPTNRGKLEDLEVLTDLRGSLQLMVICNDSTQDDAKFTRAKYIRGLEHLKSIKVIGGSAALVEGLQPHPNVRCFALKQYEGTTFPTWESLEDSSISLPNLIKLNLFSCERLQHIPLLNQLRFLTILELNSLDNLEYIEGSSGNDQSMTFFPSLESLYLINLPVLIGWQRYSLGNTSLKLSNDEQRQPLLLRPAPYSFPCLSLLDINHCPNLTSIPLCTSLQQLILCSTPDESISFMSYGTGTSQQLAIEFGNNENLTSLSIVRDLFQNLHFSSLYSLEIQGWSKIKSFIGGGLEHLTNLQELYLQDLEELEELDDDHMPWNPSPIFVMWV